MASMSQQGQLNPVLVVQHGCESEPYVLIDGYQRVSALRAMGRDRVQAIVLPIGETAALIFHHSQQKASHCSALEEGWLLRELLENHELSLSELSVSFQRSTSWVSRRLSLVRALPESVQDMVRQGKLCAHGAAKYMVPLARANRGDCEQLVSNLLGRRVSSRQLEKLYIGWRKADGEQRRRIVTNPLLYLSATEGVNQEPSEPSTAGIEALLKDLTILDAVSCRARRRIKNIEIFSEMVFEGFLSAQKSFTFFCETMRERFDAGQRDALCDSAPEY